MTKLLGVSDNHRKVALELAEMKEALEAETAGGKPHWWEVFTGPRMAYRTILGVVLQAFQQLTGANFCWTKDSSHLTISGMEPDY